ncbi:hypothetical protein ABKN59_010016 [Abortiporus biennis]
MDSEDERAIHERDEILSRDGVKGLLIKYITKPRPLVRLYQDEEWDYRENMILHLADENRSPDSQNLDPRLFDACMYRFKRFLHTVRGFHSGSLDLTGRHAIRYNSLISRWNSYLEDYKKLVNGGIKRENEVFMHPATNRPLLDGDCESFFTEIVVATNQKLWKNLQKKWRLTRCSLLQVIDKTEEVIAYLAEHPKPKFQTILLTDMPPEIIHLIMDNGDVDCARRLGATCRIFRKISLRYIYKRRTLSLRTDVDYKALALLDSQEEREAFRAKSIRAAQDKLIQDLDFLIGRPDIMGSIDELGIIGHWDWDILPEAGIDSEEKFEEYFRPIVQRLPNIISQCSAVTSIQASNFFLTKDVVIAILSLPHLCSLVLHSCQQPPMEDLPQCRTIQNLKMTFLKDEDQCMWTSLPLILNLRNLSLYAGQNTLVMPHTSFRAQYNPFKTLERFALFQCDTEDLTSLCLWMVSPLLTGLHLTHFKIAGGVTGIGAVGMQVLLRALSGSPMVAFSLYGIHFTEPVLLDRIASAFPHLQSLALAYRQSTRQTETRDAIWPRPVWEYAQHLASFQSLQYFRWNWEVRYTSTTQDLEHLEHDFPKEDWYRSTLDMNDDHYEDMNFDVKTLASLCPTLKSITYISRGPFLEFDISRTPAGILKLEKVSLEEVYDRRALYDPDDFVRSWPDFPPLDTPQTS